MSDEGLYIKTKIVLFISANMVLFGLISMAMQDDVGIHIPWLMILGPCILLMDFVVLVCLPITMIFRTAFGHDSKRGVYNRSYQKQAQEFIKLKVPDELSELDYSFVNGCIEEYAANGEIELSEHQRSTITLELAYVEATNQKLAGSTQEYLDEREDILKNILSASIT